MLRLFKTSTIESNYEHVITLDGEDFIMRFLWNDRDQHWYLTLRDSSGTDIVTGVKIVSSWWWSRNCASDSMPPGEIGFLELSGSDLDPGLRDLGTRVRLLYADEDSIT